MFLHISPTFPVVQIIIISHLEFKILLHGFLLLLVHLYSQFFMSRAMLFQYKLNHFIPLLKSLLHSFHIQIGTYRPYYGLQVSIYFDSPLLPDCDILIFFFNVELDSVAFL